jgi:DNA-binding XRE family transcriptional regulator
MFLERIGRIDKLRACCKSKMPRRKTRTQRLTPAEIERDRVVREQFASKPSLEDLPASEWGPLIKQGQYLSLMQLAAAIKRYRKQLHLSLSDLAERSGIDKAAISRFENGQVDNPTFNTLARLAKSVGKRIRIELEDDRVTGSR